MERRQGGTFDANVLPEYGAVRNARVLWPIWLQLDEARFMSKLRGSVAANDFMSRANRICHHGRVNVADS